MHGLTRSGSRLYFKSGKQKVIVEAECRPYSVSGHQHKRDAISKAHTLGGIMVLVALDDACKERSGIDEDHEAPP